MAIRVGQDARVDAVGKGRGLHGRR
jgi:hypothetical protein